MLFSLVYYFALLKNAYKYFLQTAEELYNFIKVLRVNNSFLLDLNKYLINFLKYIKFLRELIKFAAPTIISSFLLNCYSPDSYHKLFYFVQY